MKYYLVLILGLHLMCLTFPPNQLFSQESLIELKDNERFYSLGWLPDFQDSIEIVVDEKNVNQREKYCVITKKRGTNYDLHCWTGMVGLESTTEWDKKLKINFRKNEIASIRFGPKRMDYRIVEIVKGEKYLLVRD